MITVLIAIGPNSLEVPCMIFENMESARTYCDPLFAKINAQPNIVKDKVYYEADLVQGVKECDEIAGELFTDYYDGCGGAGPFVLKAVPFNEKFLAFDLD